MGAIVEWRVSTGFWVRGDYDVGDDQPRWGWKTEFELRDDDQLNIIAFNIAPDGRHLIAAGMKSGKVAVFTIAENGKLTRTSTIEVGAAPFWVQILDL